MGPSRKRTRGRSLGTLTSTLVLALLASLLLAGSVQAAGHDVRAAAAKPGKPTAKAPKGTITTATPSFTWSKAKGASKYQLRVYQGKKVVLKKTGLKKTSYKAVKALPTNVALTWKVRGSNARGSGAWSKSLAFKIATGSSAKAITAFSFQGLAPPVLGVINEALHSIALTVPFGTPVTALVPTISISGASVSPASGVARDFTSPVTYTVTAADASTQAYAVTVTVAANPAKAITAFSFASPAATGVVNETLHTIALTVPYGTPVTALVPTISISGASVSPASGVARDFTSPVTYTVTAADASTQDYMVTVTVAPLTIGDAYQGGIVAYILQPGDPGYSATVQHGLIAAAADQDAGSGIRWAIPAYQSTFTAGGTGTELGTGSANTTKIIARNGAGSTYAAGLARAHNGGGYADWYLPSKDELDKLYLNRVAIGGFETATNLSYYWSSSDNQSYAHYAWYQRFEDGYQGGNGYKDSEYRVRAVRAFPADPAKDILTFSTPTSGGSSIDMAGHTIAVTVPFGTDVTGLVATFTTDGAVVAVGSTPQESGVTANDFTSPVTYTVTAADASTQDYVVTVTFAAPVIGQSYGGGKVAYILQPGDPGYSATVQHGLIAAAADQSVGIQWATASYWSTFAPGADGTALGTGDQNTIDIVAQNGDDSTFAAGLCSNLVEGGYADWCLPSQDELNKLYLNRAAIGGFVTNAYYWSSSEDQGYAAGAWLQFFSGGDQGGADKHGTYRVRAVRSF